MRIPSLRLQWIITSLVTLAVFALVVSHDPDTSATFRFRLLANTSDSEVVSIALTFAGGAFDGMSNVQVLEVGGKAPMKYVIFEGDFGPCVGCTRGLGGPQSLYQRYRYVGCLIDLRNSGVVGLAVSDEVSTLREMLR